MASSSETSTAPSSMIIDNHQKVDESQKRQQKKQCIWIIRYGLTKYPIMEEFDTDLDPNMGMQHAECIAKRLYHDSFDAAPTVIYASPFVRCAHTAQLIALAAPTPPPPSTLETHHYQQQQHRHANNNNKHRAVSTSIKVMPVVRIELGLTEWITPELLLLKTAHEEQNGHLPRSAEDLAETYGTIDASYQSVVNPYDNRNNSNMLHDPQQEQTSSQPQIYASSTATEMHASAGNDVEHKQNIITNPSTSGSPSTTLRFETEDEFLQRCATTMTRLLEFHSADDTTAITNLAIVSHAPCNQALALFMLQHGGNRNSNNNNDHDDKDETSRDAMPQPAIVLPPWPLGGITKFSRTIHVDDDDDANKRSSSGWTMEYYGDTSHLPGKYKLGMKGWSLPCFQQLYNDNAGIEAMMVTDDRIAGRSATTSSSCGGGRSISPLPTTTTTTTTTLQNQQKNALKTTSSIL